MVHFFYNNFRNPIKLTNCFFFLALNITKKRHEKHVAFHQKFREKFSPDESITHNQLPVYFGNICLRFLPVLDIVIHRFLEVPVSSITKSLESILGHYGCLYKFHGKCIFIWDFISSRLISIMEYLICSVFSQYLIV